MASDRDNQAEEMDNLKALFTAECQMLRRQLGCDFTGVALQNHTDLDIKWPYVAGNRNEKYKYLTVRYGKGIAGKVIAVGTPMTIGSFSENILGKSTDYPVMLAEQMVSAYAVPLIWEGAPKGAFLAGYRSFHEWEQADYQTIKEAAEKVQALLSSYFI